MNEYENKKLSEEELKNVPFTTNPPITDSKVKSVSKYGDRKLSKKTGKEVPVTNDSAVDELKTRLGVYSIDNHNISISPYGTVTAKIDGVGNSDSAHDKELLLKDFLKLVNNNINKGINSIKYDRENNKFYLIIKEDIYHSSVAREISVDEESMKNYASGRKNKITLNLEDLCIKSAERDRLASEKRELDVQRNKVIAKANNGLDNLSPIEAKTYLDYLKEQDREKSKEVIKQGAKIAAAAGIPLATGLIAGAACFAPGVAFIYTILAASMGVTAGGLVEGIFDMFKNDSSQFELLPINTIKELAADFSKKRKEIKINKAKEKELLKIPYVDKMVMPDSVTIEENPIEQLELQDPVINEINALVDKAATVNSEDRTKLLAQAKGLLDQYTERRTGIMDRDKSIIDPDADTVSAVRNDVLRELAKMEIKVTDIKNKDVKKKALTDDRQLLSDKIDRLESIDSDKNTDNKESSKDLNKMFADDTEVLVDNKKDIK